MKANIKKNSSPAKKLIPAAGSLLISAAMLGTSTFAWFTMSREVEVKNIQMTATVPEDIQISLGHLQYVAGGETNVTQATAKNFTGLTDNQGILKPASEARADNGNVEQPLTGTDAISMLDWSSSADISQYYRLGKIMPASSTTGANIFFTPDAAGVGKSLKSGAKYFQAADMTTAFAWDTTGKTFKSGGNSDSAMTTLHAIDKTTRAEDKWGTGEETEGNPKYATAEEWYDTNDDGYYVDIPVWFRSSAKEDINLSVDAYVTTNAAKDDDDLYLAARAVILYNSTPAINATPAATSNLLRIRQDALSEDKSIVDFMYTTNASGDAVNAVDADNKTATYTDATEYTGTGLVTVPAGTGNAYGTPTKAIIRVWLEGEDPNCWNQNAGQNFNISLKFSKDDLSPAPNGNGTYPESSIDRENKKAVSEDGSLKDGQQVTVTVNNTTNDVLVFEYHSNATPKWDLIDGTFHTLEGKTYTFNSTTVTNSDQIAAQLEAMGTKQSTFASGLTVTVAP